MGSGAESQAAGTQLCCPCGPHPGEDVGTESPCPSSEISADVQGEREPPSEALGGRPVASPSVLERLVFLTVERANITDLFGI